MPLIFKCKDNLVFEMKDNPWILKSPIIDKIKEWNPNDRYIDVSDIISSRTLSIIGEFIDGKISPNEKEIEEIMSFYRFLLLERLLYKAERYYFVNIIGKKSISDIRDDMKVKNPDILTDYLSHIQFIKNWHWLFTI